MSTFNRKLVDIKSQKRQEIASLKTERLYTRDDIERTRVWIAISFLGGFVVGFAVMYFF